MWCSEERLSCATCSVVVSHHGYAMTDRDKGYGGRQEGKKEEVWVCAVSCLHICPERCTMKKTKMTTAWSASQPVTPWSRGQGRVSCENRESSGGGLHHSLDLPSPTGFCPTAEWHSILPRTDSTRRNNFLKLYLARFEKY